MGETHDMSAWKWTSIIPPISALAEKDGRVALGKLFSQSGSEVMSSVNTEDEVEQAKKIRAFLEGFIQKIIEGLQKVKGEEGTYANVGKGYVEGEILKLQNAQEVLAGTRKDPRSLHTFIDWLSDMREQQAKEAMDRIKGRFEISPSGTIGHFRATHPELEYEGAKRDFTRIQKENDKLKAWVAKWYGKANQ